MKPIWNLTNQELVSDEGLGAADEAAAAALRKYGGWAAPHALWDLCAAVPLLTAEIRRLRDHVHEIAQEIAERLVEEDEDDLEPGPPVYGPPTYVEYVMCRLQEHMLEQLYARPPDPPRMVGLSELLDHVAAHQKLWMAGDRAATDDHHQHVAEHIECRRMAVDPEKP